MTINVTAMLMTSSNLLSMWRANEKNPVGTQSLSTVSLKCKYFITPWKLTVESCEIQCDPRWMHGSTADHLKFCVKHVMMCLFIEISIIKLSLIMSKKKGYTGQDLMEETESNFSQLFTTKMHISQEQAQQQRNEA